MLILGPAKRTSHLAGQHPVALTRSRPLRAVDAAPGLSEHHPYLQGMEKSGMAQQLWLVQASQPVTDSATD